jgi:hypothetical protein
MLSCGTGTPALTADKRVALVIGNSAYQHAPVLKNPGNDAVDMVASLRKLGFEVIEGLDLDKAAMDRTIRDFAEALNDAQVGVFFYSGHGVQVNGQNYLVPVDAQLTTAAALDFEMVPLDLVHRTMEREAKANVIFLDACRDNPLSRNLARAMGTRSANISRGLAAVESGVGTLISFSTQPGNVALDGNGRNSPFAGALAKRILTPGDDLSTLLINVRNDVMEATNGKQIPWEHSALRARLYFQQVEGSKPTPAIRPAQSQAPPATAQVTVAELAPQVPLRIVRPARPRSLTEDCATRSVNGGFDTYCVSSVLASQAGNAYGSANLFDSKTATAWVAGRRASGIGEWIVVEFDVERVVTGLRIHNGYDKHTQFSNLFRKNNPPTADQVF